MLGGKQLLLISCAAALTAALYFAPKHLIDEKKDGKSSDPFSIESLSAEAKGQLKKQDVEKVVLVETALQKNPASISLNDSLGKIWDGHKMPFISSYYYEQIAILEPGEKAWLNAAYRYYDAFRMANDSSLKQMFVNKAITAYKKVIELNPGNLDAKTDLGLCYAEGTSSPMQGITLLREVVQAKPDHEMAQFNLGILSVRSGQYEKAVERFEKVLTINPANVEAKYLLGRTFAMMGNKELALKNLREIENTGDDHLNHEVNTLINNINNN